MNGKCCQSYTSNSSAQQVRYLRLGQTMHDIFWQFVRPRMPLASCSCYQADAFSLASENLQVVNPSQRQAACAMIAVGWASTQCWESVQALPCLCGLHAFASDILTAVLNVRQWLMVSGGHSALRSRPVLPNKIRLWLIHSCACEGHQDWLESIC